PLKILREPVERGLPESLVETYNSEVRTYFQNYRPSEEDNLKLLKILTDPQIYEILKLLRISVVTRNSIEKLRKKGVDDIDGGIKKLLEHNIMHVFQNGDGTEYYALLSDLHISLVINFVFTDYKTFLTQISQNPSDFLTDIYWRDNVTFTFNFTTSFQLGPIILSHPTTVILQFLDESLNAYGPSINLINYNTSMGIYSYTFNTSQLSFIGGESYYIAIYASKTTPTIWSPPEPLQILFKVQSVLTDLTIHNYTTGTIFPSYSLTEYWNQTFGITFYFGELISSSPITGASVTYSWAFGSGQVNPDGVKGPGYYSFFFDTGNVTEIGSYIISISAVKQNFSIGVPNPNLIITIIIIKNSSRSSTIF
ncbi:unnamed protein product, partial [marine sediment metagenome]